MPVSDPANISPIVKEIVTLHPKRVLDLGAGHGMYGALVRNYLPNTQVTGVEAFPTYETPMWECYDTVFVEDFSNGVLDQRYIDNDLVLMIDSLEHLERGVGEALLDFLLRNNKHVIVSTPNGEYPQGAVNGNPFEEHKSVWTVLDFMREGARILHTGICVVASLKGMR